MELLLLSLPWIVMSVYLVLVVRHPVGLPDAGGREPAPGVLVSVIVPARNEEANILRCVASLCASEHPSFEVIVVDDRSEDRTAEIVEGLDPGNASRVRLIRGAPLPEGWFGKPWACFQGAREARGNILLFTDADTIHSPDLLARAVRGSKNDHADLYTLIGGQVMGSFWEQLLQPQFFLLLAARYPGVGTPRKRRHWRHAIANGQYLLFSREAYEGSGGHEVVAGEVVEDLRLAQNLVRGGWKVVIRGAEGLRTRMYSSLGGLVEGWSKNVATAALQTTPRWLLPVVMPASMAVGVTLWLLPPTVLVWALLAGVVGTPLAWAGITTSLCVGVWVRASALMKGNPLFGFIYPLGSILALYIFLKSWWRGSSIEWKGRKYRMSTDARRRPPKGLGM